MAVVDRVALTVLAFGRHASVFLLVNSLPVIQLADQVDPAVRQQLINNAIEIALEQLSELPRQPRFAFAHGYTFQYAKRRWICRVPDVSAGRPSRSGQEQYSPVMSVGRGSGWLHARLDVFSLPSRAGQRCEI